MLKRNLRRCPSACMACCLLAISAAPSRAANSSPWKTDARSAVRIVAAKPMGSAGTAVLRAGVEIRLPPGWRTYGCDPGDAGVPPEFDFSASENVKSVVVRYPKPERFQEGGASSFGYRSDVIFPLRVVPKNASTPVKLHLKLDYAICETLCIPARAEIEFTFSRRDGAPFNAAVSGAEAQASNNCPKPPKWAPKI